MNEEKDDSIDTILKIRYKAFVNEGKTIHFSPGNLKLWLNGIELREVIRLNLVIDYKSPPTATISFRLDGIDIDTDSMLALEAIIHGKESGEENEQRQEQKA